MLNENPPNVRRIDTSRDDAYGFEICGHVTTADVENLYGLLEGAYTIHDKIDVIVVIHDYEGFDWDAAWREQTIIGKTNALKHIRKYAVVGGPSWMASVMGMFKPFLSIEMKHFEMDAIGEAWEWIEARPAEPSAT